MKKPNEDPISPFFAHVRAEDRIDQGGLGSHRPGGARTVAMIIGEQFHKNEDHYTKNHVECVIDDIISYAREYIAALARQAQEQTQETENYIKFLTRLKNRIEDKDK